VSQPHAPDPGGWTFGDEEDALWATLDRLHLGASLAGDDEEFRRLMGLAQAHRRAAAKLEAEAGQILAAYVSQIPR
jgi:hypothetical protein